MGSSGLLDCTVHLVRLLHSICMPCVIAAFEKRSGIIVANPISIFYSKGSGFHSCSTTRYFGHQWPIISILYVFSVASPALLGIFHARGYQRNATSTLSKLQKNVCVVHVVLDHVYAYRLSRLPPPSSFRFSAALCSASRIYVRKVAKPCDT